MEKLNVLTSMPEESISKLDKYITTTGNVHYFKDYYYYVDKKKLYKCSNNKIREIPMKNSYFIIKNIEGKQCCVSWLKLDLQFLQRSSCFKYFQSTSKQIDT